MPSGTQLQCSCPGACPPPVCMTVRISGIWIVLGHHACADNAIQTCNHANAHSYPCAKTQALALQEEDVQLRPSGCTGGQNLKNPNHAEASRECQDVDMQSRDNAQLSMCKDTITGPARGGRNRPDITTRKKDSTQVLVTTRYSVIQEEDARLGPSGTSRPHWHQPNGVCGQGS